MGQSTESWLKHWGVLIRLHNYNFAYQKYFLFVEIMLFVNDVPFYFYQHNLTGKPWNGIPLDATSLMPYWPVIIKVADRSVRTSSCLAALCVSSHSLIYMLSRKLLAPSLVSVHSYHDDRSIKYNESTLSYFPVHIFIVSSKLFSYQIIIKALSTLLYSSFCSEENIKLYKTLRLLVLCTSWVVSIQ